MAAEEQIRIVVNYLTEFQVCESCGTRFRFGDLDCPHCGLDLDEVLRRWAERLLEALEMEHRKTG